MKRGKKVCWEYGKGKYCGTLIPSMVNAKNRYARTKNGKIKTLPKGQEGGSTTNPYTIYMNYINGIDNSEVAKNIFDKLNRMHYNDAKERGMGVANYIATNVIADS